MDTNIAFRKTKPEESTGIVTAYRLTINNYTTIKNFLTLDPAELSIKAVEVLQENDGVELIYLKFKTSKELFVYELKQIAGCI